MILSQIIHFSTENKDRFFYIRVEGSSILACDVGMPLRLHWNQLALDVSNVTSHPEKLFLDLGQMLALLGHIARSGRVGRVIDEQD